MACCCGGWCTCVLSQATVPPNNTICQSTSNGARSVCNTNNILATVGTYGATLTAALTGKGATLQTSAGTLRVNPTSTPQVSSGMLILILAVIAGIIIIASGHK